MYVTLYNLHFRLKIIQLNTMTFFVQRQVELTFTYSRSIFVHTSKMVYFALERRQEKSRKKLQMV